MLCILAIIINSFLLECLYKWHNLAYFQENFLGNKFIYFPLRMKIDLGTFIYNKILEP